MSAKLRAARSSACLCRSFSSRSPWARSCSVSVSSTSVERSAAASSSPSCCAALAPALQGSLSVLELELRAALQGLRLIEPGRELAEQLVELRELDFVARDVRLDLGDLRVGALKILGLPLDQILAMLNGLLETRDLGADPVVAALNGIESLVAVGKLDAQLLDRASRPSPAP